MVRFQIAGIPVTVQPVFWILAVLLGLGTFTGFELAIWVAVVFVSVLVHELGHAFMVRASGIRPLVVLHAFGGLTSWEDRRGMRPQRRVLVTLAGPIAGFALAFVAWVLFHQTPLGESDRSIRIALGALVWVNVIWGIFNLVPIRGLDGGQAVEGILQIVAPKRARWIAEAVFIITGAAAIVYGIASGHIFIALVAAFLTFGGLMPRPSRSPTADSGRDRREGEPAGDDDEPRLGI